MNSQLRFLSLLVVGVLFIGCSAPKPGDPAAEAPPSARVDQEPGADLVSVEHPDQFPVVTATSLDVAPSMNANGAVTPDVARQVPVISLAAGRVVEIHARLGDTVRKGQLLMRIQSADISGAFSDYQKSVADEKLARSQLERSKDLKEKGAIAQKDLDVAQNNEDDAKVEVENNAQRLRVLGAELDHPTGILDVRSPISGVITEQNITAAGGVKSLDNSSNLFTVSDLSQVWILCDVYENDLPAVHLGEYADVHLAAYPNVTLKRRISDIGPVLDPNTRSAKVRLQVANPGMLRAGMFVTATFHGLKKQLIAVVPSQLCSTSA